MKKTKSMRFRELLPIIIELENSKLHLQEGIVEMLNEEHNLDINLNTYRNYLYRYHLKNNAENSKIETSKPQPKTIISSPNSTQDTETKISTNTQVSTKIENDDDDYISPEAIAEARQLLEKQKNDSLIRPTLAQLTKKK